MDGIVLSYQAVDSIQIASEKSKNGSVLVEKRTGRFDNPKRVVVSYIDESDNKVEFSNHPIVTLEEET